VPGAGSRGRKRKVAEEPAIYSGDDPKVLQKEIKKLEKQMYTHARDLEFEEAAQLRDQVELLTKRLLES
jgi:excinuclease ABC subunit B